MSLFFIDSLCIKVVVTLCENFNTVFVKETVDDADSAGEMSLGDE